MKQLMIATVQKQVGEDTLYTPVFQIRGETEEYSSNTVDFTPYDQQIKLIARDPNDPMKVTGETVYFEGVRKGVPIPDSRGTNALGRSFPSWEGGTPFDIAKRREQARIAGWYPFLFGEVTFPGKTPIMVNFRMTNRVSSLFRESGIEASLGRAKEDWPSKLLTFKVKQGATAILPDILFTIKQSGLDLNDTTADLNRQIAAYIEEHNGQVIDKQHKTA